MNTRDLFELCQLDALGLLDEQERSAFDAAFLAAPPEIRAQLRREQARWVRSDFIGVEAEPPEGLRDAVLTDIGVAAMRDRVLSAVHEQIEHATVRVEGAAGARMLHESGRSVPALRPVRRVSRLWRAAALGFASAAVGLAAATLYLRDQFDTFKAAQQDERVLGELSSLPVRDLLFNSSMRRVVFTPQDASIKAQVALNCNLERGEGRLFCSNLPAKPHTIYRVFALDARGEPLLDGRGQPRELASFASKGGFQVIERVRFAPGITARIALCEVPDDRPGEFGKIIMTAELA